MSGIIGEKVAMTQIFSEDKTNVPVTIIKVSENRVVGVKTVERDGYKAIQLGYGLKKKSKIKRCEKGVYKSNDVPKFVKEFPINATDKDYTVGQKIGLEFFDGMTHLDVTGCSISKGFQGVMKKHGMHGGPKTHGSHFHRRPGSIGACAYPGRVWKGKKMAGRMGGQKVTMQKIQLVDVDKENGLILVKGAVPGHGNNYVFLKESVKLRQKKASV